MPLPWLDSLLSAKVYDLEQPRFQGMPIHPAHKPGYLYVLHRRHRDTYRPNEHGPGTGETGPKVPVDFAVASLEELAGKLGV